MDILISKFKNRINQWAENYTQREFVFNYILNNINFDKVKCIIVGDNPGNKESEFNKYFVGPAGLVLRSFFETSKLIKYFEQEVVSLNKTCIKTKNIEGLKKIFQQDRELVKDTSEFMAYLVYKFHEKLECPVYIIGLT